MATPEWLNQRIFAVLARFIPHLDEKAPVGRLQTIFPHFRDCLDRILVDGNVREEFYSPKCRLLFGRIVHSLLSIFEQKNNDKSIRLECSRLLCQLFEPAKQSCADSASIAFVLPGVVTKCSLVVCSEPMSQFVGPALDVIRKIVCSAFNDRLVKDLSRNPDQEQENELALRRHSEFFQTNAEKIVESFKLLIEHVANTQSELHRQALFEMVDEVWRRCESTFIDTNLTQLMLQLAVRFASDDWESIRSKANKAIHDLNSKYPAKMFEQIKPIVISCVTNVFEQKANSLDALHTISNFLSILSRSQMKQLFMPKRKEKNLLKRLRCALELVVDVNLNRIVACDLNTKERNIFVSIPLKDTIEAKWLDQILTSFVKAGMTKTFFRSVANSLRSNSNSKRIHSALILAHLCRILKREHLDLTFTTLIQNHLKFVWLKHLERFIDKEPDPTNSDPTETSSLWHTRESAFCCALLASVVHSMQSMDPKRHDFQRLIVDVLYTILQFLPSTNMVCASAAHVSLEIISKACNQSVSDFLNANADKVVYKAAMQARNLWKYPRAPFALAALLDRSYGRGMVDELSHLIPEFLVGISTEDSARIVPCLKAMKSFVVALTRWFPELLDAKPIEQKEPHIEEQQPTTSDSEDESQEDDKRDTNEAHWQRLERLREKFEKLRERKDEELEQQKGWRPVPEDEKPEPPKLIKCVHKILERIQHLHHSPFPYTRLLLADLLCDGLRFIRQFDDQLLPMIHQNWVPMSISMRKVLRRPNLNAKASEHDKLVVAAELRTVACMCELSKGFVYTKIVDELDEPLQMFMENSVKLSQKTASVYSHSANFKLQATILGCWPTYCELAGVPIDRARQTMQLYANDAQQNGKLRELAEKALNLLDREGE